MTKTILFLGYKYLSRIKEKSFLPSKVLLRGFKLFIGFSSYPNKTIILNRKHFNVTFFIFAKLFTLLILLKSLS